ncbi:hypothetical protein [Aureimonas sp. D3]|uniref:hypothetical protein n=1 Tax=Aureimonas sp. D3 TaxID=1638164 RepID=UPI000A9B78FD|nr:hypothetical protein [Aureimonas sp. D3]
MSLIADALQPNIARGLFALSGRPSVRHMSDTILIGPKSGYDLDIDDASEEVSIDFREGAFIAEAFGGDASRLASASFTTMSGLVGAIEDANSLPWALIRLYYASFYSGHGLIRLMGHSCTYFENKHVQHIKSLLNARGTMVNFALSGGLYSCKMNTKQTGFTMIQARGRVGGAHEAFWELFDGILSEFSETLVLSNLDKNDARDVLRKVEAARRIFRKGGGASWLSSVRNEIQYRHGKGVWSPLNLNRSRREALSRLAGQWTRDPMDIEIDTPPVDELPNFVLACVFTIALCRCALQRLKDRSPRAASSFAQIPLRIYEGA